jgi:hypothetical protein
MTNFGHDALYHATQIPEFKKAGFVLAHNDNRAPGRPVVQYKKHYSPEAVMEFFDIDRNQFDHLFGHLECDPWGVQQRSLFADNMTSFGGIGRENEPPAWTAGRIRLFVREFPKFKSYKTAKVTA